jgi:hypothetical protein
MAINGKNTAVIVEVVIWDIGRKERMGAKK